MALAVRISTLTVAVTAAALLAGCERPPVESIQRGYRGLGMEQVYNPRTLAEQIPLNQPPATTPVADDSGPRAGQVFQNVKVLGHLSVAEFTRHMAAITQWVSPVEGCTYCHTENLADDSKYQKVVSRRMIEMTQQINSKWTQHVAATGVTCYTCHRGQAVPSEVWFSAVPQNKRADFIGNLDGQNQAATTVGLTSLPYDPFSTFLKGDANIRVYGTTALPAGTSTGDIKSAEHTYGLMMHMSGALGVNCTYCHNTNAFGRWDQAAPQRVTAWHAIRLTREVNNGYMEGLTPSFPANRLGPNGDVAKVNCATCHQGAYKPLYGAQMAKDYVGLKAAAPGAAPGAAPAQLPPPVAEAGRTVLYFPVGSSALDAAQSKGLAQLIETLATEKATTVAISGFHSAAGQQAANEELAKQRAVAVRDALVAAGVPAERVTLAKPQSAEANLGGEDPAARRVEVTLQ